MTITVENHDKNRRLTSCRRSAGWTMRTGCSVIQISGTDRMDLLHRLTTNDLRALQPGKGKQTVLLTEKARIIDVVTLLQNNDDALLIGSPGSSSDILSWIRKYVIMDDVRLRNLTDQMAMIEVMGPRSGEVVEAILGMAVGDLAIAEWRATSDDVRVVRMPSACELSYWLIGTTESVAPIAEHLSMNDDQVPFVDEKLVEYLRVLGGMGRLGNEWTLSYNPLEAGLLHLTSFTKGCYIGQEVVARLDSYNKVKQRIMGLVAPSTIQPGDEVMADGASVGMVTSSVQSFDQSQTFALAYVRGEFAHPGTSIHIKHGEGLVLADLVLPPIHDDSCP